MEHTKCMTNCLTIIHNNCQDHKTTKFHNRDSPKCKPLHTNTHFSLFYSYYVHAHLVY